MFKPNYNILKLAGSSQGFKHSPETIAKLKKMHTGNLHPRFGTKASEEQKALTSLALKKYYGEHDHHSKGKKGKLSPQFGKGGTRLTMTDEQGTIITFPSINSARLHFRVRFSTISKNINKSISYIKIYYYNFLSFEFSFEYYLKDILFNIIYLIKPIIKLILKNK